MVSAASRSRSSSRPPRRSSVARAGLGLLYERRTRRADLSAGGGVGLTHLSQRVDYVVFDDHEDVSRAVFDAAPENKTFFDMRGGHNDAFLRDEANYIKGLREFLAGLGLRT